jgi:hypothetical protein
MLGVGFSKLVFLVIVIAVVWYGFKWLGRTEAPSTRQGRAKPHARSGERTAVGAQDTVKCPVCETYVVARDPGKCGRAGCPYPGRN